MIASKEAADVREVRSLLEIIDYASHPPPPACSLALSPCLRAPALRVSPLVYLDLNQSCFRHTSGKTCSDVSSSKPTATPIATPIANTSRTASWLSL